MAPRLQSLTPRSPWLPLALFSLAGMSERCVSGQTASAPRELGAAHQFSRQPETARYNLKWGRLIGRFSASATAEYSDNLNLSASDPQPDLSFGPTVGLGWLWSLSEVNTLELDFSAGYRWYVEHPSVQTVSIAPDSFLDYRILFDRGQISLHDRFSVGVDPTSRPDVSGEDGGGDVLNFRRVHNVAGVGAEWRPAERWSVVGGYDFGLDRSLTSAFESIDRDDHTFSAGAYGQLSPRLLAGLSGAATLTYYVEPIQNDARQYHLGPMFILEPSPFITIDLRGGYTISEFAATGTIGDGSSFEGFTGRAGIRHRLNRRMGQEVRVEKSVQLAVSSNYYDILGINYSFSARVSRMVTVRAALGYEHYQASGAAGEEADRFNAQLGCNWQMARRWQLGAAYTFNLKDSDRTGNDYTQNRVSLQLTREF